MKVKNLYLILIVCLWIISCEMPSNNDEVIISEFEVIVTGDVATMFSGVANYATYTDPAINEEAGILTLLRRDGLRGVTFTGKYKNFPNVREFDIVEYNGDISIKDIEEGEFFAMYVHTLDIEYSEIFNSMEGYLSIDTVRVEYVTGTFDFTAAEENNPNGREVNISGWFKATEGEIRQ